MANCPVCNKTGLPDYKNEEVVCSQCNSDLKAFKLLSALSANKSKNNRTYIYISIIAVLILLLTWQGLSTQKTEIATNALDEKPNIAPFDSSHYYKKQIAELQDSLTLKNSTQPKTIIAYTIKKGDCLS